MKNTVCVNPANYVVSKLITGLTKAVPLGLAAGMMLSFGTSPAAAQTESIRSRSQRPVNVVPVRPSNSTSQGVGDHLATPTTLVGNWTGVMNHIGDDVVAHYELSIQSGGQGTWRILGSEYNETTDTYEPAVLSQGSLTSSAQSTTFSMELAGRNQPLVLEGEFKNGGSEITGQSVNSNLAFRFSRS